MDRVSIERMCAGRELELEGADTEKAREEKLLVIPAGLVTQLNSTQLNRELRTQVSDTSKSAS